MIPRPSLEKRIVRLTHRQARVSAQRKKLEKLRLFSGLSFFALFCALSLAKLSALLIYGSLLTGIICWLPLVYLTSKIDRHLKHLSNAKNFLERQLARRLTVYEKDEVTPHLLADLGTTGKKSLFHQLDETISEEGRALLLGELLGVPKQREEILAIQNEVSHLSRFWWPVYRLTEAGHQQAGRINWHALREEVKKPFLDRGLFRLILFILAVWVLAVSLVSFSVLPAKYFIVFTLLSIGFFQKVGQGFGRAVRLENEWSKLDQIIKVLRAKPLAFQESGFLQNLGELSQATKTLSRSTAMMSTQSHPLLHFLIHMVLPWNYLGTLWLESGRKPLEKNFEEVSRLLIQLEVRWGLAFCHRFQTSNFAKITDTKEFSFENLSHPLLPPGQSVSNTFTLAEDARLVLLTGSNMSGKSTFLRTIGLNAILAMMGGPVFADKMRLYPFQIFSCLEISDSLRDGFSYFYAEVRKLRLLAESLEEGAPLFYLVDELFRGTNNKERYLGAIRVIERVIQSDGRGIISSHDLELTHLADKFNEIKNYHFRDEIKDGAMHFPYKIFSGPATTTNALKILEQEGFKA